jgi:hypothetical protein
MPTFYRVKAVPGRLVVHPGSLGTGSLQMIGHTKSYGDPTFPLGRSNDLPNGGAVPTRLWTHVDEAVLVQETQDDYLRRRVQDGELELIEVFDAPSFEAALKRGNG